MSAAFDTVKHTVLLDRFAKEFGITDYANAWLSSYFTNRNQQVNITGILSDPIPLTCGMPQGSILGPKGYPMYVSPVYVTVRNIGAIFDAEMKMLDQVSSVCKASYASLHSLGRIRKYLNDDSFKTLVHAFITCKIDNFNSLLSGVPKYAIHKLQMVLNNAARLITRQDRTQHITNTLIELHWLPIDARIDFKILLFTYKALNDLGPEYISNILHFKQHKRDTRSSSDFLLLDPPKTLFKTMGDRAFAFNAVKQWNVLPLDLRSSPTLSVFKKNLKTYLFKRSYPDIS